MLKHGDPILKRHAEKVRILEQKHPHRDWKTNLPQGMVNELADEIGEPGAKKDIPQEDSLVEWLREAEQIKD